MKKCSICHIRPAEVPDRNIQGRPIKRICKQCHIERLKGDLGRILGNYDRNKKD